MKGYKLPFGIQDYLPGECCNKIAVENKLCETFAAYGYYRIETPAFEYYDIFKGTLKDTNKMFKFTDSDGALLALRPDTTVQVCRLATKLDTEYPVKLYYISSSFEFSNNEASPRSREFAQAGVELIGDTGEEGDFEAVLMAIESLLKLGINDFLIELGHIDYFKGLMEEAEIGGDDAENLSALISSKDMLGIEMFLQSKNVCSEFIGKFMRLSALFGGEEVLAAAEKLTANPQALAAVKRLRGLNARLKGAALDKYVSFDLGLVGGHNYYSGIVFRGVSESLGLPLLDGGRYDNLVKAFTKSQNAVGFAMGIKRILTALDKAGSLKSPEACDYAYINIDASYKFEYDKVSGIRKQNKRITKFMPADEAKLKDFCLKNNIPVMIVLSNEKMAVYTLKGERRCR